MSWPKEKSVIIKKRGAEKASLFQLKEGAWE